MQLPDRKYKWLFLPLETKVRELDGKLLLAAIAVERGWAVIIGRKNSVAEFASDIRGIVIEKDGLASKNDRIDQYIIEGKHVCVMDEEGLVYLNSRDYYRRRLDADNLHKMEYFFLWGGIQHRDVLEHIPGIESKLVLTGNPRFDLLRPEFRDYYTSEGIQLKNKYGNFILINTNFADSNHFLGTESMIYHQRKRGSIKTDHDEAEDRAFIEYQARIVDFFVEMIPRVSASYPHHKIIIRPHPSENHQKWFSIAHGLKNVSVIHEGDVNPWLLAADMFIHNSCMTGIQGFLLDKPGITYMPIQSDQFDYYIPNALSIMTTSMNELVSTSANLIKNPNYFGPVDRNLKMQIAEHYITGITGSFASDRILNTLETLEIEPNNYNKKAPGSTDKIKYNPEPGNRASLIDGFINKLFGKINETKLSETQKTKLAYSRQKFPGLRLEEVQTRITRLKSITNRFERIQIHQISNNLFFIQPD
ncbi:surface carbohydrate biosynthesis protein [Chloroflexota bacterium]